MRCMCLYFAALWFSAFTNTFASCFSFLFANLPIQFSFSFFRLFIMLPFLWFWLSFVVSCCLLKYSKWLPDKKQNEIYTIKAYETAQHVHDFHTTKTKSQLQPIRIQRKQKTEYAGTFLTTKSRFSFLQCNDEAE